MAAAMEISYSTLAALADGLKVYWLQNGDGSYEAWVGTDRYFTHCSVRGENIALFEAGLKPTGTLVESADDALVLSDLDRGNPKTAPKTRDGRPVQQWEHGDHVVGDASGLPA